jgi:hypothetical protein
MPQSQVIIIMKAGLGGRSVNLQGGSKKSEFTFLVI